MWIGLQMQDGKLVKILENQDDILELARAQKEHLTKLLINLCTH